MRSRVALIACLAFGVVLGYAIAHLSSGDRRPAAEIELRPSSKTLVRGQAFTVDVRVPDNLSYDPGYRLMRREDGRWVAKFDLTAAGESAQEPPYVGPSRGPKPNPISGALGDDRTDRLRLPLEMRPGRYRLKKWFLIWDEQARAFADDGYQVSASAAIEVAWWTDFDVVDP